MISLRGLFIKRGSVVGGFTGSIFHRNPQPAHSPDRGALLKSLQLVESIDEIIDQPVEISLVGSFTFDLLNGVDHRRMVLATEASPDLRE